MRQTSFIDSNQTHQESVNSTQDFDNESVTTAKGTSVRRLTGKDEKQMKRYLTKIFEKMQESNTQGNGSSLHTAESPDPLNEHSNSIQESSNKRDQPVSMPKRSVTQVETAYTGNGNRGSPGIPTGLIT